MQIIYKKRAILACMRGGHPGREREKKDEFHFKISENVFNRLYCTSSVGIAVMEFCLVSFLN